MAKKFNYKVPSMVALTLVGTAFTAHHAQAAETTQDQTSNKNVLDSNKTLNKTNQAKSEVSNPTQNISGTQVYQDPSIVQPKTADTTKTHDASLEEKTQVANSEAKSESSKDQQANDNVSDQTVNEDNASSAAQQQTDNEQNSDAQVTNEQQGSHTNEEVTTVDNAQQQNQAIANKNAETNQQTETTKQQTTTQANDQQDVKKQDEHKVIQTLDNNTNSSGYRFDDDEDDDVTENESHTEINPQTLKSLAQPATTQANDKAATVSESTNNVTPRVATFSSIAKPRMLLAKTSTTTKSLPKYKPQVNSSINDYIRRNKLQAPKIEEDYTSYFPKYGYRHGVGKPEGIVVHDTANDNSTITGEINYMKNNYNNAFVHAFVDGNRIIETHPTDYLSWGAGPNANNRFINVEIVHTHDYASFARSMNNYADYAATQLQYYGLVPDSAEKDGRGTVWTHYAISNFLGGTDHADPHGYLASHNYSYNELYDLINEKYLIKMGKVAAWGAPSSGTTSGSTSKPSTPSKPAANNLTVAANNGVAQIKPSNNGLYTTVYDKAGKATKETQKTLAVSKTATLNNQKFYLVQDYNSGKKLGWVKQGDVVYNTAKSPTAVNHSYSIKPATNIYTVPWGTSKQVAGKVSGSKNQTFKATKQQQIDKAIYLYGSVNGITGWVSKYYLSELANNTPKPSTPSKPATKPTTNNLTVVANNGVAQIKSSNNGLFTTVYDKTGKATKEIQKTFAVSKTATLNNQKFYLVQDYNSGKALGWVKEGDVTYNTAKSPIKVNETYTVKSGSNLYTVPWGSYKQVAGKVSGNGNQTFKATKQQQIDKAIYLYGTVNGQSGWISKYYLTAPVATKTSVKPVSAVKPIAKSVPATNTTQTVSKIAQVNAKNSGVRASVYDKSAKSGTRYADRTFVVTKQRTHGNETYVLLNNSSQNTPIGWFNVKDLNLQNLGKDVKTTEQYKVNATNSGLTMIPWGTKNQIILTGNQIANKAFNAIKQVAVGKDVYLYGTVNNRTGWVNAKDLTGNSKPATVTNAKDVNYTYVIKNDNGYYYVSPNAANKYSLKSYHEQPFAVIKEQVINGQKWFYGKLSNGKLVWIKESDVAKELIKYTKTGQTLNQAASIQSHLYDRPQVQRVAGSWTNANYSEIKYAMDTNRLAKDSALRYQFLRLDQPQNISVDKINKFLKGKGVLENQGAAFSEAAKKYGINEVYLISHALLETGNGKSQLAKGANIVNGRVVTNTTTKYHNVFGIAAFDNNPLYGAINYAKNAGWNSVSKAIVGGAKFIGQSYIKAGQNTLYKMRWNPSHPGTHQYATDIDWANINAQIIKGLYDKIGEVGKYFDIPKYN
ncbi:glucosaminidase domain-containing protein [Staphylococcus simiae]|uniref:Bifunctional autolysin n=1 Tax=Staphylococcus simiae CCM 7213 = CCUG 51256 TaxID=911238 RepID=G5JHC1_9STAP|nr:glucosaminidase domain-containing protein [Staphylococcus simiae]EHJ08469.1 autolysin [Staphylococcus simiae CCM 7213 = CCUG 51256]SNV67740.1 autolysin [Staphylococcus simiae]